MYAFHLHCIAIPLFKPSGLSSEEERGEHRKSGRMPNDIDVIQTDKQLFAFYECEPKIWTVLVRMDGCRLLAITALEFVLHSSGY